MSSQKPGAFARLGEGLRHFFLPPAGASTWRRLAPYLLLGMMTLLFFLAGSYAWDYTNSPVFCGATCHTMPPEYTAYQVSPHARVDCVDCHIGRGFIATRISRKAGDFQHVVDTLFRTYEYPIFAEQLRPARETCERCHFPSKFSDDSLRQIISYLEDENNTRISTYLALRTGGGTRREGLGRGIHWHVENEVWFVALDDLEQEIPYVRVVGPDGQETVYTALDSTLSPEELAGMEQVRMDCITCHNRITHNILPPEQAVDQALFRQQIDSSIPYIRREAVRVLSAAYDTDEEAREAIRGLADYYAREYPEYYAENQASVEQAVELLLTIYSETVFREQQLDWTTHPNNIGHTDWPGCWRCHDGQHVNSNGDIIRLECNLCHSIPQVQEPGVIEPVLPLATGAQPESHFSTLWIAQHRDAFDQTCQACHTVSNPGGTDNSSFCSNSACHGTVWQFAGLDAPGLADLLAQQMPPSPIPEATGQPVGAGSPTFSGQIGALFQQRCTTCHSQSTATGGLVLETYNAVMAGGSSGAVIVPGDAEGSLLVQLQREGHFAEFTPDELQMVIDWINSGAPEN
jgi:nitrate/TMAO reductase-like tetraheme cytochrome c subunit/cytochrome c5